MNLLRLLHMPKIEEPLKKIVRQRNFLGSSKKMARRETCERRQRLAVACADKKKGHLQYRSVLTLFSVNH